VPQTTTDVPVNAVNSYHCHCEAIYGRSSESASRRAGNLPTRRDSHEVWLPQTCPVGCAATMKTTAGEA
jgi:hypothetical protein